MPSDTPSIFSISPYARFLAEDMYPGQAGQDDQNDAARHMLAAGTLARKYGVGPAEFLGRAHEYTTSPIAAFKALIGAGKMPKDYDQDMHNNALGARLGARARSQTELEDMVNQMAEQATKKQTTGKPWISRAEGGAVDLSRPFVGYRSAGRRPESQQDRTASANAPLAALRGMVSGVLGAPGDIESFVRMLPGLSEQTVLPTSEDVEKRLPMRSVSETPVGRAFTTAGQLGGGFYTGPGAPLRAVAALPSAISKAGRDFALAGAPAYVVKPKGGNWLAGSVERAVEPLKVRVMGSDPATRLRDMDASYAQNLEAGVAIDPSFYAQQRALLEPEAALNNWLDTKLTKYLKNEMATPKDPLRLQADEFVGKKADLLAAKDAQLAKAQTDMDAARQARGFTPEMMTSSQARIRNLQRERDFIEARTGLHVDPAQLELDRSSAERVRDLSGNPALAQGDAARAWENASDVGIGRMDAGELLRQGYADQNPWLAKVPPKTDVYLLAQNDTVNLGFKHLADELKNALNPNSGLPQDLLLKYADLEKMSVPQVAQRVDEINAWRSVQKVDADMAKAMNPATQVIKEYPESGTKWVELRQPKETGKVVDVTRPEMDLPPGFDERQAREVAEDMALDEMLDPGTRAYDDFVNVTMNNFARTKTTQVDESYKALEDALKYEGETMGHCVGGYCPDVVEGRSKIFSLRDDKGRPHVTIETAPGPKIFDTGTPEGRPGPEKIVQIKGKGNRAPVEEYLPAVQDFVKSGKWSDVGDLQNTGLTLTSDRLGDLKKYQDMGIDVPEYTNQDDINKIIELAYPAKPVEGFADGGYVDYDPARIDQVINRIRTDFDLDGAANSAGFAEGGAVSGANFPTDDFDPARIDSIVGELHAMNAR
jgi:hypothetical protein